MNKFQTQIGNTRSQLPIPIRIKNLIVIKHHLTYMRTGVLHHHHLETINTFLGLYLAKENLAKIIDRRRVYLVVQGLENPRLQILYLTARNLKMAYLFIDRLHLYGVNLVELRGNENTHDPYAVKLVQVQIFITVSIVKVQDLHRLKKRLVQTFET